MKSDPGVYKGACDDEQPQHRLYLPAYYIAKTPITNAQYAAFVRSTHHDTPEHWKDGKLIEELEELRAARRVREAYGAWQSAPDVIDLEDFRAELVAGGLLDE